MPLKKEETANTPDEENIDFEALDEDVEPSEEELAVINEVELEEGDEM